MVRPSGETEDIAPHISSCLSPPIRVVKVLHRSNLSNIAKCQKFTVIKSLFADRGCCPSYIIVHFSSFIVTKIWVVIPIASIITQNKIKLKRRKEGRESVD